MQAENNATLNNAVAFATTNELLLEKMLDYFKDEDYYDMRLTIAERTDISATFVQKLANDPDSGIRTIIARNQNLNEELAQQLADDKDRDVSKY